MTEKKQTFWANPSTNPDLEGLMREFGCTDDWIADYPIHDPLVRCQIGNLIGDAVRRRAQ